MRIMRIRKFPFEYMMEEVSDLINEKTVPGCHEYIESPLRH